MEPAVFVLQPDAVFHQRYRVVRCIKAGGMGVVYEVLDQKTSTRRALKVMLPGTLQNPEHRARFAREATITGGIESDHIVRVSDAGIDDATGTPFLVMELLRGEELADVVARQKMLPPREVVTYLWQVALALDKTHAASIVHRDLKPENLFITRRDDGSPCVKIFDFGIAKIMEGGDAPKTRALGTPLYMAPEQIRGASSSIGPRTDLYTLGHIAYAALAGEPYWEEESSQNESLFPLLAKVVAGATEPPVTRARRRTGAVLPQGFDAWFQKATSPRAEERFDRATVMISALAEALGTASATTGSEPIATSPSFSTPPSVPLSTPTVEGAPGWMPSAPTQAMGGLVPVATTNAAGMELPGPVPTGAPPVVVVAPAGRGVVVTAIVALALVAIAGIGAVAFRSRRDAPEWCGPRQICRETSVPDPAHVEPLTLLAEARRLASRADPKAALQMISASGVKNGSVELTGERAITYSFVSSDATVVVMVQKDRTAATPSMPSLLQPVPEPRCSLDSAWRSAVGAGFPADAMPQAMYMMDSPRPGAAWRFFDAGRTVSVDGVTCAVTYNAVFAAASAGASPPAQDAGASPRPPSVPPRSRPSR